ncbi:MAG: Asp-tRNA(Asn)/Glu-tRNA(Gln) amidotransferase subunit GatC [Aquificaceae bacterium]
MTNEGYTEKTAYLARIELRDNEREVFKKQLIDILNFVEKLKELDTHGVDPLTYELGHTPLREDEKGECLSQDEAIKNAPQKEDGFFVVPRILET